MIFRGGQRERGSLIFHAAGGEDPGVGDLAGQAQGVGHVLRNQVDFGDDDQEMKIAQDVFPQADLEEVQGGIGARGGEEAEQSLPACVGGLV
jgi:hypothetical protein